ncbi:MAG: hypothetical protein LBH00_08450 [Planctomycetaceae bacterium]|nr:hypothetical protein [Planctomycetaceae bacterium]
MEVLQTYNARNRENADTWYPFREECRDKLPDFIQLRVRHYAQNVAALTAHRVFERTEDLKPVSELHSLRKTSEQGQQ